MTEHRLKVEAPYFDEIAGGSKPFEVRRNDRGYQKGDTLILVDIGNGQCDCASIVCTDPAPTLHAEVTYVYAGDPRFGGIEPGYVVLGIRLTKEVSL